MVKLAKAANQQAQKKKAPPPKQVEEEEDSSEEESSEEEETPPAKVAKKATPAKAKPAAKNGVTAKKAESEDEDDDSEEEAPPPKKTPQAKQSVKPAAKAQAAEESSEEDEDDFATEEDLNKALELNGKKVMGQEVKLDKARSKENSQEGKKGILLSIVEKNLMVSMGATSKTLVVNNLSFGATEDVLQSTFEKAVSVRIPQRDGRPKGFGFVDFDNESDCKAAKEAMEDSEIDGSKVTLDYAKPKGEDLPHLLYLPVPEWYFRPFQLLCYM
ncbi:hypothetical protein XENOCAPTIV_002863 [Xenoophorus captivus]|uniref:RRM domain-containing protein n=1 Tax=Xenoophorus captivus TaxID=1517983 RepID=A0ABV0RNF4_9TELE